VAWNYRWRLSQAAHASSSAMPWARPQELPERRDWFDRNACALECIDEHFAVLRAVALIIQALEDKDGRRNVDIRTNRTGTGKGE
jgi:hypothetical protein